MLFSTVPLVAYRVERNYIYASDVLAAALFTNASFDKRYKILQLFLFYMHAASRGQKTEHLKGENPLGLLSFEGFWARSIRDCNGPREG